jgi:hypothetical protein
VEVAVSVTVEGASVDSEPGSLAVEAETEDVGADEGMGVLLGLKVGRAVRVRVRWREEELWIGEALTVEAAVGAAVVAGAVVVAEPDEEPEAAPVYRAGPGIL